MLKKRTNRVGAIVRSARKFAENMVRADIKTLLNQRTNTRVVLVRLKQDAAGLDPLASHDHSLVTPAPAQYRRY